MANQRSKTCKTTRPKRRNVPSSSKTTDAHERKKDFLTEQEVDRLREAARAGRHGARDDCLILMMYRHGLRASEAAELTLNDLDLSTSRIWIGRLKGSLSTHHPIPGDELRVIKRYLAKREDDLPWLFVTERGGQMTRKAIYNLVTRIAERAGLQDVHPHTLRHSCGYYLANRGTSERVMQDYLGHRNPRHTMRYTRVASSRFDDLWSKRGR